MRKLKWLAVTVLSLSMFLTPVAAQADVNNFMVTNFTADETLTKNDPQGQLHVVEHINVDFTDQNHGILRALPERYKKHSLQLHMNHITSSTLAPTQYSTYESGGNQVFKIGSPEQTVTGPQEYTLDYSVKNVITFYNGYDELYWNVNGDQWQQPFNNVSVNLQLPAGLKQAKSPRCYNGAFTSTAQDCTITTAPNNGSVTIAVNRPLAAGQTLTYVTGFSKGYFKAYTFADDISEYAVSLIKFLVPILLIGVPSIIYWFKRGRDAKGTGIIVPQYDPPEGMSPIEAGTIIDFSVDNRDITATIIDLAIRHYIKIVETKHDHIIGKDSFSYNLELTTADFSNLNSYEHMLIVALFAQASVGQTIDITAAKSTLYTTATSLRQQVSQNLTANGYFRSNPQKAGKVLAVPALFGGIAVFYLGKQLGLALGLGMAVAAGIAFLCSLKLAARTAKGVAANEHMQGLKLYLNVAEKDRLNALQGPNAKYAANQAEPVKTVDLFEKLLPYAMALGVEQQWAKQFQSLYTAAPSWYSGNFSTFNAIYLVDSLNTGIGSSVNSAFSAPSSSGSSGFGGGGFAGGGGGGGGGGGW